VEHGFPLKHCQIAEAANAVLQAEFGTDCEPVGDKWVFKFLDRHHGVLSTFWSKSLDSQRARSLNPEAVKSWVKLVEKWIVGNGVSPDRIYGMDENRGVSPQIGFTVAYNDVHGYDFQVYIIVQGLKGLVPCIIHEIRNEKLSAILLSLFHQHILTSEKYSEVWCRSASNQQQLALWSRTWVQVLCH
jgi:hypothetical protein